MDLEQAKKHDHKIMINEIAISKVPLVIVKELSLAECKMLQQEHKSVLRTAMEDNDSNEVLSVFQISTNYGIKVLGDETGVNPMSNPSVYSMLAQASAHSLAFLHNHPSTNSFSLADIGTFIQTKELGIISVVTNQGEVHILNKSINYDFGYAVSLAKRAYNRYASKELSHNQAVRLFLKNCYKGGIVYERGK